MATAAAPLAMPTRVSSRMARPTTAYIRSQETKSSRVIQAMAPPSSRWPATKAVTNGPGRRAAREPGHVEAGGAAEQDADQVGAAQPAVDRQVTLLPQLGHELERPDDQ